MSPSLSPLFLPRQGGGYRIIPSRRSLDSLVPPTDVHYRAGGAATLAKNFFLPYIRMQIHLYPRALACLRPRRVEIIMYTASRSCTQIYTDMYSGLTLKKVGERGVKVIVFLRRSRKKLIFPGDNARGGSRVCLCLWTDQGEGRAAPEPLDLIAVALRGSRHRCELSVSCAIVVVWKTWKIYTRGMFFSTRPSAAFVQNGYGALKT